MTTPQPGRFEIRKYPNRRFYDVTRSRHVTLADLHELVTAGNQIVVTDSATGNDITNVVLAQIILEHDPPKLDLFPASLLHQAIQANEQMVRKFVEQYFSQAMDAFVRSRKQFDDYLSRIGFSPLTPLAPFDWVRMLFPQAANRPTSPPPPVPPDMAGFGAASMPEDIPSHAPTNDRTPEAHSAGLSDPAAADAQPTASIHSLQAELAELRSELATIRGKGKATPPRGRPRKKAKR